MDNVDPPKKSSVSRVDGVDRWLRDSAAQHRSRRRIFLTLILFAFLIALMADGCRHQSAMRVKKKQLWNVSVEITDLTLERRDVVKAGNKAHQEAIRAGTGFDGSRYDNRIAEIDRRLDKLKPEHAEMEQWIVAHKPWYD